MRILEGLLEDTRFAWRSLRKRPSFTVVAILSLAVALGANTAVFSFARTIVLDKLPVPGADRLVILRQHDGMFHMENCCFTHRFFEALRKQDVGFDDVLAVNASPVNLTDQDQTEKLTAEMVSGNYFTMLGVRPLAGRLIDESDDVSDGSHVCVISYRLWQERFGGRDVIGRRVLINTTPFQIVGVTPRGFVGAALHEAHEMQIPASAGGALRGMDRDKSLWLELIARLKPGVTVEQAAARLNVVGFAIEKQDGTGQRFSPGDIFSLIDGSQGIGSRKEQFGRPVVLLFGLTMVVLLVACANLTALLLVRSMERSSEAGVRLALGGTRAALVRAFLAESMTLAIAGGIAGWALAQVLTATLLRMLGPQSEGLARNVRPDGAVFAFCATMTLAAGLICGFLPAWRAAQSDPLTAIRARASAPSRAIASRLLIAGQMALSFALLFVAGLFVRTLHNLRAIDVGLRPENVALLQIDLSRNTHAKNPRPFFDDLLLRTRELSDTRAASLSTVSVLSGGMMAMGIRIPGYTPANGVMPTTYFTAVSSGYFRTLGIPLIAGRDLTAEDGARHVAIVNQQFANEFFRGDALGKSFEFFDGRPVRIIGIAANAHFQRLREEPLPVMYLSISGDTPFNSAFLQVCASSDSATLLPRLRALVAAIDPRVPIDQFTTMELQIDRTLARERLLAFLSATTGGIAVLLAAIGLYGVMSFMVAQRRREIGIRVAIGATGQDILSRFLADGVKIVAAGAAMGIPLALASGKAAASLLYGVQSENAATAVEAAIVLAGIALAAGSDSGIPGRARRPDNRTALGVMPSGRAEGQHK